MYLEKVVNTERQSYVAVVRMDRGDDFYDLEIYEKSVTVTIFGIKRKRDPIVKRRFDLKIPPTESIIQMIQKWEIADQFHSDLVNWDGRVKKEMILVA
ncbi:hypothetical protein [Risungbinella massiliensis]|uniref:hypothetical protein n=1 Tax=Risungbinella massiliensis TaxID=1329796 RepID=UPI0005CC4A16|nr:hypothetical protein [Risungbinella massiliensis]